MTGWRVHPTGAQVLYGVEPDLTCLGKVVGGGLPAAAYGGRRDLMEQIAPAGPVYQAGTLSGNPLAMAAGLADAGGAGAPGHVGAGGDVRGIRGRRDRAAGDRSRRAGDGAARRHDADAVFHRRRRSGTTPRPAAPTGPAYNAFFHAMLEGGVYLAPSAFEAAFTSAVHGDAELVGDRGGPGLHMAAVAIVGAGVAGLTAAYRLKRRGIRVVVYEASRSRGRRHPVRPTRGLSRGAGSQLRHAPAPRADRRGEPSWDWTDPASRRSARRASVTSSASRS